MKSTVTMFLTAQGAGKEHGPHMRAEEGENGEGEGRLPADFHPGDQHPAQLPPSQHRRRQRGQRTPHR